MSTLPPQMPGALPWGCTADSILTVTQMATWLQLSPDTVLARAKRGDLHGFREGDEWRFHPRSYLAAKGQIASRWDEALNAWTKLTAGFVTDSDIKRHFWTHFAREFAWFEANGAKLPA